MDDNLPFSVALWVESNVYGKESMQLRARGQKSKTQSSYVGENDDMGHGFSLGNTKTLLPSRVAMETVTKNPRS